MKLRFDPSKPHGTVTPSCNGAVWFQAASDGKSYYFNGAGEPVDIETGEVLSVDVKQPKPEPVVSEVTVVKEDGTKEVTKVVSEPKEEKDPKEELLNWLKGVEGAEKNWMTIRSYGKQIFGKVAASKEELISFAIDAEMIPADQVRA